MVGLEEFGKADFDGKRYINNLIQSKSQDVSIDKYESLIERVNRKF